ncbi:MFS transporter [Psychrobacter sp.]|uniref:MFS transporter n=1 Tax=Psychrobacter sp. TaxID=56811 RepID=UPI0025E6BBFD|nr:MFS transporter [Psychrobacter sp.]
MSKRLPLFSMGLPRIKTLHYTWFAFFVTFLIWFAHVALMPTIKDYFSLTEGQVKAILVLNVALTIPARLLIGAMVDKYGPKRAYSALLFISGLLCFNFAFAQNFQMLAIGRFLLGFVGAGFVVGIRLISEWFPSDEVGTAEGIYGGWGNFGAAVASMSMPILALMYGGPEGWRYAIATTGVIAIIYAFIFYRGVSDTPKGATYFKPNKSGGLEVSSKSDFYFYAAIILPIYLTLFLLIWRLSPGGLKLLTDSQAMIAYIVVAALTVYQYYKIWTVNHHLFEKNRAPVPADYGYQFKQVAILSIAYMACFGSELAVVSMLPQFFITNYGISHTLAGLTAGCFAVMNLFARPGGGFMSDAVGRRKVLMIALAGQTIGFILMSQMTKLPLVGAVLIVLATSVFVQSACGAVYSVVPLIQRRMTGQIAGTAGAYGNVGGVFFLTVFSMVSPTAFFIVLAVFAAFAFFSALFLSEPKGHMVEVHLDGTVERIKIG